MKTYDYTGTSVNKTTSITIAKALQGLGWEVTALEQEWFYMAPSADIMLLKSLEDSRYDNRPAPVFTFARDKYDSGYTIYYPTGLRFTTITQLLIWAADF